MNTTKQSRVEKMNNTKTVYEKVELLRKPPGGIANSKASRNRQWRNIQDILNHA